MSALCLWNRRKHHPTILGILIPLVDQPVNDEQGYIKKPPPLFNKKGYCWHLLASQFGARFPCPENGYWEWSPLATFASHPTSVKACLQTSKKVLGFPPGNQIFFLSTDAHVLTPLLVVPTIIFHLTWNNMNNVLGNAVSTQCDFLPGCFAPTLFALQVCSIWWNFNEMGST